MLQESKTFSSFSTNDISAAQKFYGEVLQLRTEKTPEGLAVHLNGGAELFIYPKPNHTPATFTVLNFRVAEIEKAVDELIAAGVVFEQYKEMHTDDKGIMWGKKVNMGPNIAWFKDPAGNILSITEGY